jgi:hypothetical protein
MKLLLSGKEESSMQLTPSGVEVGAGFPAITATARLACVSLDVLRKAFILSGCTP